MNRDAVMNVAMLRSSSLQRTRQLVNRIYAIAFLIVVVLPLAAHSQTWSLNANGNWTVPGNWTPSSVPNSVGATATFGPGMSGARTVTVDAPVAIGSLTISGSNAFTFAGAPDRLTFDVATGIANLTVAGTAAHTFSTGVALSDTLGVTNGSTGALTFSGVISGVGGLAINAGSSSVTLSGANTYTGATQITNGVVNYATGSAIPAASAATLGDGIGTTGSARLNINLSMLPAQALALSMGSDGLLVQGNNRFVRLASVSGAGELRVNSVVGNGFEFTGVADGAFGGVVTGGVSTASADPNAGSRILKSGTATQTFSGSNTFNGRLFVNNGRLVAASNGALGTSSLGFNNATFVYGAGTVDLAGGIATAEQLYLNGAGFAGLGALRSSSGSNVISQNITLGWSGGTVTASDAAIGVDGGSTLTINGTVTGANRLTKVGDGTLVLNTSGAWTGGTTFAGGTLRLGVATAVPAASSLTFAGGTFDLNGFSRTIPNLTGAGGIALGSAALTVDQAISGAFSGPITGTGTLTKTGAGVLTLIGSNSYSGGTTVSAGTLQGDAASLQGNILNNATVVFDQAISGAFAGIMSGTGSLTKTGAGTLVLTGANTYTGITTITHGTLVGDTSSLRPTIVNNAALVFNQTAIGTYAGDISGTGSLTKVGAGTLALTGVNSYAGLTTISDGVLIGSTTSLPGDVQNDSSFVFDQGFAGTFAGDIVGSGDVTKVGVGALRLTGINSYAGGTTISGGSLIGSSESIQGDILNNAALVFDQTIAGAFDGAISGSGSVTKVGVGTLTLIGTNSYSGGTTVTEGELRGDTRSLQGNILNNAEVVFDETVSGAYAGVMMGTGSLTKVGLGTLFLNGANTFSGGTFVDEGTLAANGAVAGPLIVRSRAILAGQGNVGDVQVLEGGTISPGNSIGTLTLSSLDQAGTYELEYRAPPAGTYALIASGPGQSVRGRNSVLDPSLSAGDQDADLIYVTSSANLAASSTIELARLGTDLAFSEALIAPGNTNRELRYLILRADGGVTGRYVALSESGAELEYLNASGSPGVEDVWLVLRGTDIPIITNSAPAPFALPMQGDRPRCDLESLSLGQQRCFFVQGDVGQLDGDADAEAPGTDTNDWSGSLGFGAEVSEGLWLGIALGAQNGDADLTDGSGSADYNELAGTLWGNWQSNGYELRGWLSFGGYDIASDRATSTGGRASADYDGNRTSLAFELRRWQNLREGVEITPLLGLSGSQFETDAYTETGGGIENFRADSQSQWSLRSLVGFESRWQLDSRNTPVTINASIGWAYEFGDTDTDLSGTYEGDPTGTTLRSTSPKIDQNEIVASVGATVKLDDRNTFRIEYGLGYNNDVLDQAALARWSLAF